MFQKLENQKLIVTFEGKEYEALYSFSNNYVAVEIRLECALDCKKTAEVDSEKAVSTARMLALQILKSAKDRGDLR